VAAQDELERQGAQGLSVALQVLGDPGVGPFAKMHAVWVVAHLGGPDRVSNLFAIADAAGDSRVRAQAVRAIADLCDPSLADSAQARSRKTADVARRLTELVQDREPVVLMEVIVALGRLRWEGTADWLRGQISMPDAALAHAAMQALRRSDNWPAVLALLDEPD
jgi:hypothetical protein